MCCNKIVHIIICYYNEDEVINFINNKIMYQIEKPYKIYIVNNGTNQKEKLFELKQMYPNEIEIFDFNSNLGYWGGFLAVLNKINYKYDFIILSNTDISFINRNFYKLLLEKKELYDSSEIGVIAPSIFSEKFKYNLNPYMKERPKISKIKKLMIIYSNEILSFCYNFFHYLKNFLVYKNKKREINFIQDIYAPHGSFMIFTSEFINNLNFSYKAFLFGEEIFIGEVCYKLNLKVKFVPYLQLIHHEHTTTGIFQTGKLLQYKLDSLKFLYDFIREGK